MKERISKEKTIATGTALLAAFTLAACGESGSEKDKNSAKIGPCPAGYSVGAKEVTGSREEFRGRLGSAITELDSKLPRNKLGEVPVQPRFGLSADQRLLIAAAVEVFHQTEDHTNKSFEQFEVYTPENRIDDLSEQFCSQDEKLYVSPQTATAIGAMHAAGIKAATPEK